MQSQAASVRGILPSLAAAMLLATGAPAFAQADPMEDATGAEAPVGVVAAATGTPARAKKKVDLLVAPVPFSSPASGAGLAGGAVAFYNPNNAPSQWVSGGGIVANQNALADFMYDNMTLEMNVIHSAWKNGCKKLEFLGSSCIYPRMAPQPMKENCLLTSELEKTNEAYALAKISGLGVDAGDGEIVKAWGSHGAQMFLK